MNDPRANFHNKIQKHFFENFTVLFFIITKISFTKEIIFLEIDISRHTDIFKRARARPYRFLKLYLTIKKYINKFCIDILSILSSI